MRSFYWVLALFIDPQERQKENTHDPSCETQKLLQRLLCGTYSEPRLWWSISFFPMTDENSKKQEVKEEKKKEDQVIEELSDDDLEGLNGGVKQSQPYMV